MTSYYAILRAIPNKLAGILAMGAAIAILFFVPWLDKSPVKSIRYKGLFSKIALFLFVISFFTLGYLGMQPPSEGKTLLAQICSLIYFVFFLSMPILSSIEKCKNPPERVK